MVSFGDRVARSFSQGHIGVYHGTENSRRHGLSLLCFGVNALVIANTVLVALLCLNTPVMINKVLSLLPANTLYLSNSHPHHRPCLRGCHGLVADLSSAQEVCQGGGGEMCCECRQSRLAYLFRCLLMTDYLCLQPLPSEL